MKIKIVRTGTGYDVLVYDENKMIPDPAFARKLFWALVPPLVPRGDGEPEKDFKKREAEYAAAVKEHEAMIRREAKISYDAEFHAPAPVDVSDEVV